MSIPLMVADTFKSFGVPVVIRPGTSTAIETSGLFQTSTVDEDTGESRSRQPSYSVTIPGIDAVQIGKNTLLTVNGQNYKIVSMSGDGVYTRRLNIGLV